MDGNDSYLMVNPNERRVVICENPYWPHFVKTAMAQALFDLEVPGIWFSSGLNMALYATGDATGMVLDLGMAETRMLPVSLLHTHTCLAVLMSK
jgi:actin-related protein